MAIRIIRFCFYLLFIFTPLLFTPYNNELFEFNKMLLTYSLTAVITGGWLYLMTSEKRLIFRRTILDIPLVLFLLSQILSTIFSIDPHTSIWGYYSRLNGGLMSIISYLLLYWAFVSLFNKQDGIRFLKSTLIGGVLVAAWAIPEHFGYSPSCAVLVGRWAADCWVQDVQSRVFATLGQPNWLAAYMGMLVFPAIYFFLIEKTLIKKLPYYIALIMFYLAFTFTFSRGGMLGVIAGVGVTSTLLTVHLYLRGFKNSQFIKPFGAAIVTLLIINLLFGSALTGSFRLLREDAPPPRPSISTGGTQLENGGTESGKIRLIVWRGALEVFKHYPILGSGVETFAYSYYMFRPVEHNLVSEWDFLYNKAHNEYLNYLATTGIVGLISYLLIIFIFCLWAILKIFNRHLKITNFRLETPKNSHSIEFETLLLIALMLGSYTSFLIQNIFGFSVVMIAVLFYLTPAFVFVISDYSKSKIKLGFLSGLVDILYKRALYSKIIGLIIVLLTLFTLMSVFNLWRADVNYKLGSDASDAGSANKAYTAFSRAYALNPDEPLYQSDFGNVLASAAVALTETDSTESADLKKQAILFTENSLNVSPANVSLWRTAIRTYYVLSVIDPEYDGKTIEVIDKAITLAPTDPKLYYNKGLILSQQNKLDQSIEAMKQAIDLKTNYREAKLSLGEIYIKSKQNAKAVEILNEVLIMIPNDPDALKILQEATQSADN